ncbi:MAG: hypothetical protein JRH10_08175 [Deltaproteobacteria bacterium]|nr:hypothetical protein [Deltaproteobacteria bacterium]
MNTAAVREHLAGLQAAQKTLHELPIEARVSAVGRVLDAWSDAGSPVRVRLLAEHPATSGLSTENLAAGLELGLRRDGWGHAALEGLVEREAPKSARLAGVTTVLHGGVIPMPTLLDALAPLVLGSPVLAKPAARDLVTPRLLVESVAELAPELGACIAIADVRRDDDAAIDALLETERVIVTGGDDTVTAIRARLGRDTKLVAHGHKLSVAWLGADANLEVSAARLAVDVATWDQLGCLSPVACWVEGDAERARAFATSLAAALEAREQVTPRGEVEAAAAARIASERSDAELRSAAEGVVALHVGSTWTVVAEGDAAPRPSPLHRFVRVHPVATLAAWRTAMGSLRGHVAGLAHAGGSEADALELAQSVGASRATAFGELQTPPLDWARDGLGVLSALLA